MSDTSRLPPTGTVTFLFTDIEGSVKLWEQHAEEVMHMALAHHAVPPGGMASATDHRVLALVPQSPGACQRTAGPPASLRPTATGVRKVLTAGIRHLLATPSAVYSSK